jgi:hypothetical protein
MRQRVSHGVHEMAHPERDVYLAKMKNSGRAPTFMAMAGYERVRGSAADFAAAERVELVLGRVRRLWRIRRRPRRPRRRWLLRHGERAGPDRAGPASPRNQLTLRTSRSWCACVLRRWQE